jgi:hypothetical protein
MREQLACRNFVFFLEFGLARNVLPLNSLRKKYCQPRAALNA